MYESYVVGMLTNFDKMPIERIHNMLKMFCSPPWDRGADALAAFLGKLVADEKLQLEGGQYKKRR